MILNNIITSTQVVHTLAMEQTNWTLFFISLCTFIFLYTLSKILIQKKINYKNLPPSPTSIPIIGHIHLLKEPLHRTLQQFSDKYGPIFSLKLGSRRVVIISSPLAMKECFTTNDIVFANRPLLMFGKHIDYDHTTIGSTSYGPLWRDLRRVSVLEFFSTTKLNACSGIRQEEVKYLVKNILLDLKEGLGRVEMKSRLSALSFNVVMRMVTGKRYFGANVEEDSKEAKEFRDLIRETFELGLATNLSDFLSICKLMDFGNFEKMLIALHKKMDLVLQRLVDEQRHTQEVKTNKTLVSAMLSMQESEPQSYSDIIIKGMISTLLLAGTDTSSAMIEWAMSLLLNHPKVLRRARVEIDNIVGHNRLVDESDISQLKYLQCIVNETQRLLPVTPLLVPHEPSEDVCIGGFDIPRGSMLLANAWAIHRDPNIWEDPTSFKPERFENITNIEPFTFVPFGFGRRQCPGAPLANRIVTLCLATTIQCFNWERIDEDFIDLREGRGFTMHKRQPLEAICKIRQEMAPILAFL